MKNTIGQNVSLTIFGESHGSAIGAVIDGLAAGIEVDESFISKQLDLRRPIGKISTPRVEMDNFEILSGEFAKFENTSFKFENVTFTGGRPCLKGLDGTIYEIEQSIIPERLEVVEESRGI